MDSKEHSINLTDHEARGLHEGRINLLVRAIQTDSAGDVIRRDGRTRYFIRLHKERGLLWVPHGGASEQFVPTEIAQKFCPFGSPGIRLACREGYALEYGSHGNELPFIDGRPLREWIDSELDSGWTQPHYRATDPLGPHWRSPATMPLWAVRTHLEIAEVQARRVQSITEEEAWAAGATHQNRPGVDVDIDGDVWNGVYRASFRRLWDSHHKPGQKFADDPWCWFLWVKRGK